MDSRGIAVRFPTQPRIQSITVRVQASHGETTENVSMIIAGFLFSDKEAGT
jgi:hypothetical protein